MHCPKCEGPVDFITTDQKWWCNPCLSFVEGTIPVERAGLTASESEAQRHAASHDKIKEEQESFAKLSSGILAFFELAVLGTGLFLLLAGWTITGSIVVGLALFMALPLILF